MTLIHGSSAATFIVAIDCIASCLNLTIFFHLFYQLYGVDILVALGLRTVRYDDMDTKLSVQSTKRFSIISCFLYTATTICLAVDHSTTTEMFEPGMAVCTILWTLAQLSCYLLWITRLYWIFEGSVHQSSKSFFYSLGSLAIVFALFMSSTQIVSLFKQSNQVHHTVYFIATSVIVCVIDLSLSSVIMYRFLSKLQNLTIHCHNNRHFSISDYNRDIKKAKMIQAESQHFKQEKKQFKRKMKSKAKKKGVVIPSNIAAQQRRKQHGDDDETHSRLLNDIKLSTSSVTTSTTITSDEHVLKGTGEIELLQSKPSISSDSEPFVTPPLENATSALISNILQSQTALTSNDVKSPPLSPRTGMSIGNYWNFTKNPVRTRQSQSVFTRPTRSNANAANMGNSSDDTLVSGNPTFAKRTSKSVGSPKEAKLFEFKQIPQMVLTERLPVSSEEDNAVQSAKIADIDNRYKFSVSSVGMESPTGRESTDLLASPTSLLSNTSPIYKPIHAGSIEHSPLSTASNATVQIHGQQSIIGEETPSKPSEQLSLPFDEKQAGEEDETGNLSYVSSDFAMIDVSVEPLRNFEQFHSKETDGHTLQLSFVNLKNSNGGQSRSVASMVSSRMSEVSTPGVGGAASLDPERIADIVRTPEIFDYYRQNLSLDDRQKLLVVVMTKYTLLSVVAVLSTQMFVIMGTCISIWTFELPEYDTVLEFANTWDVLTTVNVFYFLVWNLDCMIGTLCCYLNFKMNDKLYYRLFKCCDKRCRRVCAEMSKNKMIQAKIDERAQNLQQYLLQDQQE